MSKNLNRLLDERNALLNNIEQTKILLQNALARATDFDERYKNQKKITYTGKKVTEQEILQNVEDIQTNIPKYNALFELYTRQNNELAPLIAEERQKINNETKKSEQKYAELRTKEEKRQEDIKKLQDGLTTLRQTVSASASASTKPLTFMERLTQRITLPSNVKIVGESSDEEIDMEEALKDVEFKIGGKRKYSNKRKRKYSKKNRSNKRKKRKASRRR